VVGRSPASLQRAEERYRSVAAARAQSSLFTHAIADLSERIDVAIIATNSDVRLAVLQELVEKKRVGALILEKVVFQSDAEFALASTLGAPAWVNCFRRALPGFADLRSQLRGEPWSLSVEGGAWGLGCNAVHYLDLCAFLADSDEFAVDAALDPKILASKRPGFVEFTGRIRGTCGNHGFEFVAHPGSAEPPKVRIGGRAIDETSLPLQSELTHLLVEEILATSRSSLPTLAQSRAAHAPLLELFTRHLERMTGQRPARCPVT